MDEEERREIEARLTGQVGAYHEAAMLFTAISSGIVDLLSQGPLSVEILAETLGFETVPLRRLLRGLVAIKLCEESTNDRFSLTPVGQSLCHGGPSSLREKAIVVVGQYWLPWMSLIYCLKSGKPSFPFSYQKTIADWRGGRAEEGKFFFRYLAKEEEANADGFVAALEALDPLAEGAVLASLGGGYGAWLLTALRQDQSRRAVVFDAPPILDEAMGLFAEAGFSERTVFEAGDILEAIPVTADVYVLKAVLQNYEDEAAQTILENCREAMKEGSRLIIAERLMPESTTEDPSLEDPAAIMLDLHMMAITGGKARDMLQLEALISTAGLAIAGTHQSPDGLTLIDVRRS